MTNRLAHSLSVKLIDTADQFKLDREPQTSSQFKECLNGVEKTLPMLDYQHAIQAILLAILAAQEAYDWLGLVDDLEYEMTHLLESEK